MGTGSAGAALVGLDGSGQWAQAGKLQVSPEEAAGLVARMSDYNNGQKITAGGFGYFATACEPSSLSGRKGSNGICVAKSGKALCIVTYDDDAGNSGLAMSKAQEMAEDLIKKGF